MYEPVDILTNRIISQHTFSEHTNPFVGIWFLYQVIQVFWAIGGAQIISAGFQMLPLLPKFGSDTDSDIQARVHGISTHSTFHTFICEHGSARCLHQ